MIDKSLYNKKRKEKGFSRIIKNRGIVAKVIVRPKILEEDIMAVSRELNVSLAIENENVLPVYAFTKIKFEKRKDIEILAIFMPHYNVGSFFKYQQLLP